jgi:hypothetical protein
VPLPVSMQQLVDRFVQRQNEYEDSGYLEARLRIDFLNPMFEALGWDVTNKEGHSEGDREVVTEARLYTPSGFKAPDYVFKFQGSPVFIVEAKKPSVNLREDPRPALQLRRYAWNSQLVGIGVVTDFQEFAVYDCSVPPAAADKASAALLDYYRFEEYAEKWDQEIYSRFSREAVEGGALDEYESQLSKSRGKRRVDRYFLRELEDWRRQLAVAIAESNELDSQSLNYATTLIIDRIVFLRICESRGIEPYGSLRDETRGKNVYSSLKQAFARADERYNSGLFHFRKEPGRPEYDTLTPELSVPNNVLTDFIGRLYWPDGPYDFAVFPPDVLGQVYEQFLGKTVERSGGTAIITEKPEVRKAGGVYYTPTHIVRYIVERAFSAKLDGQTPAQLTKSGFRVCDPSCGSGSFLIEAFQYLLDWHLDYYVNNNPERWTRSRPKRLRKDVYGSWRLVTDERKRILLDHIFGVDIDPQAVEVTKLSLLLKVLEGETDSSLQSQYALFHERALPDLEGNIKCGNSLVGTAFHLTQGTLPDPEMERRVNAFDWDVEFPEVATGRGFDVVIGNPPWLMAGYYVAESVPYLHQNYKSAEKKFDLYYVFIEQGRRLLAPGGTIGLIVPNKFFHTGAAAKLRDLLIHDLRLREIVDFGTERVFEGPTNYSCILLADNASPGDRIDFRESLADLTTVSEFTVATKSLSSSAWNFQDSDATKVFKQMEAVGQPLETFAERFTAGVQSGADRILTLTSAAAGDIGLEPELVRPLLRGRDVRAFLLAADPKNLVFPYRETAGAFVLRSEEELRQFPVTWQYLNKYKKDLAARIWFGKNATELSGDWYGLMYLQQLRYLQRPHLVTPALSNTANFAIGDGSLFATGTAGVTGVVLTEPLAVPLDYLLGLLNSDLLALYVVRHSPVYQGGYHKFSTRYLRGIPIVVPAGAEQLGIQARIVELVKQISESMLRARSVASPMEQRLAQRLVKGARIEIDKLVHKLYQLDETSSHWVNEQVRRLKLA